MACGTPPFPCLTSCVFGTLVSSVPCGAGAAGQSPAVQVQVQVQVRGSACPPPPLVLVRLTQVFFCEKISGR